MKDLIRVFYSTRAKEEGGDRTDTAHGNNKSQRDRQRYRDRRPKAEKVLVIEHEDKEPDINSGSPEAKNSAPSSPNISDPDSEEESEF